MALSAQGKVAPITVKTAKGVYFWDVEGKRYLDFNPIAAHKQKKTASFCKISLTLHWKLL